MADDILLTPEEQDEKARKWVKENGLALAIGITLGLGAILGYNQYKTNVQANAEQASALYSTILKQMSESDIVDIEDSVATLKQDFPKSAYAAKAALMHAAKLSKTDLPAALSEYQWISDNANEMGVQHTARIRQAKIHLAMNDLEAATSLASQQPYDNFASHYYEILGDIAVKQGELEQAYGHYQQATDNLISSDAAYASVLALKMAPLPKPDSADELSESSS